MYYIVLVLFHILDVVALPFICILIYLFSNYSLLSHTSLSTSYPFFALLQAYLFPSAPLTFNPRLSI